MRMQPLAGGLVIPAGESVALVPHGYHLMLEKLVSTLVEGESIPLTLNFDDGRTVEVELAVGDMDGMASEPVDHGQHHH